MISTGKVSMKKFCAYIKEHPTEISNCEKKEMLPLTKNKNTKNKNFATCANKNYTKSLMKIKTIVSSGIIVITQENIGVGGGCGGSS